MSINPALGASSQFFGHQDYDAALSNGFTNESILKYLQANQGQLAGNNAPGGGGLYDEILNSTLNDVRASQDNQLSELSNRLNQSAASFSDQQNQFRQQMAEQQSAFERQTAELTNISRASVPNAERSAAAEQRRDLGQPTGRKSGLSSLAIVSGLGTQANPLSGLQLA